MPNLRLPFNPPGRAITRSELLHENKEIAIVKMSFESITNAMLFLLHRVLVYASNNLIEDPAMLAIIFC